MKNIISISLAAGFALAWFTTGLGQVARYHAGESVRLLTGDVYMDAAIFVASTVIMVGLSVKVCASICKLPEHEFLEKFGIVMPMYLIGALVGAACINVVWYSQAAHFHL